MSTIFLAMLLAAAGLVAAGSLLKSPAVLAQAAPLKLKFGNDLPATHSVNVRLKEAIEAIEGETKGQLAISMTDMAAFKRRILGSRECETTGIDRDENGIDAIHRHDAHLVRQRAAALRAQGVLQLRCEVPRPARGDRQQGIGLAREHIDVEGPHELHQRVARVGLSPDQQRVAGWHRCDPAAGADERLQRLH